MTKSWARCPARRVRGMASVLVAEGGVEGCRGLLPQQRTNTADRLFRAVQAIHAGVLPLDRDRAGVADLAWMNLRSATNAFVVEDVEDRIPPVGEVLVTGIHDRSGNRRELGDIGPDLRPGEADHGVHAELARHLCGELQLFGSTLAYTLRVPVAPHSGPNDRLMTKVDRIVADRLSLQVVRDRPDLEPVPVEDLDTAPQIGVVLCGSPHIQVLAGACDLQAVVAPLARVLGDLFEREIRPLAGEEGDRVSGFLGAGVRHRYFP